MLRFTVIALGGAAGALARYWMSSWVYRLLGTGFPWGTLAVNVAGSLAIGFLAVYLLDRTHSTEWRALLIVGFLGAFTTFSTFSLETLTLIEEAELGRAIANAAISVVACLAATWLGTVAARAL